MIRKKKKYVRPRQIFEAERIKEENALVKKYGLKNKLEIWKALAKVNYYRGRAKELAKLPIEEQEVFLNKLKVLGLKVENMADVLGLKVEDILERRLSTVVMKKKLASAAKGARQMVVHKKILIGGKVVSSPSYLIPVAQEGLISVKKKDRKPKTEEPKPEETVKEEPKQEDKGVENE